MMVETTVKPGYGSKLLHLRTDIKQLREAFGGPSKVEIVTPLRQYWFYPERNFECLISRKSHAVLGIFLHAGNPIGGQELFESDEAHILGLFGKPDSHGGGFEAEAGYVGRWLNYDRGIGFDFDRFGMVATVSLYTRRRAKRGRASALTAHVSANPVGIAALTLFR